MGRKYYKRGWHHTKTRGREHYINCGFCGKRVPKYKTFPVVKGFRINDPMLKKELGFHSRYGFSLMQSKFYACPSCARHRNIVRKKRR